MQENILSKLLTECPFPEVFEDTEKVEGCSLPVPRRKIGHIRADYDGWRWYNTVWPCHKALATPEVCTEIDRVYDALIAPGALKDLAALRKFCADHMYACISKEYEDEFSFYYVGERCNFWIRLITRRRDYNMYLNAYIKEYDNQKYFDRMHVLIDAVVLALSYVLSWYCYVRLGVMNTHPERGILPPATYMMALL